MKHGIIAATVLAASTLASIAGATTFTYTFDDMTYVPDHAKNTFNTARYWENRGVDRWGTVWETPYTFSTTYPSSTSYGHFHIDWKTPIDCLDTSSGTMGHTVNGKCVAYDPMVNRGPFETHTTDEGLYFQLIKQDSSMVPFVVQNIDVYNKSTESITLFVRKQTDGGWFYWTDLHGYGNGTPSYFRWYLSSGYTGKFTAMAWLPVSGASYVSAVGRVQVTD